MHRKYTQGKSTQGKIALMLAAGVSMLPLGLAGGAVAQETQADDNGDSDVVVVSARRREESLQDVPLAVTAVSGAELDAVGAVDITDIQRLTPNATIEVARGSNSTLIAFIRGVGQQDPLWGFEPGVGVYVDDVYIARPQGAVMDIFDVERIEVLRGPQGTLYGRNTIGGAIKYVTKDLNLDEPEFRARVNYGSYSQFDQIVTASIPLSSTFAVGGSIANYQRDGFGENLYTGAEHYNKDLIAGRLSALWQPTDDFSLRLSYDKTEDNSNAKHGHRLLPSGDGTIPVTDDEYDTRGGLGDDNSVETEGYSLTAAWDLSDTMTLKYIGAHREGYTVTPIDFDALPQPDFDVPAWYGDEQNSHEVQLQFDNGTLSGIGGVYYLDGEAEGAFDLLLASLGLTVYQGGYQQKENLSVYADMTWDINEQWDVSLGGRFTQDDTTADVIREAWLGLGSGSFDPSNTTSVFLATQTGYEGLTRSDEKFTPRVSVSYEPTNDLTLYASYAEGFKAGGFDPRAREDLDPLGLSEEGFGPETVASYEVGAKGNAIDGRLQYAATVFLADYTDQQITVQQGADADNDGTNDTFVSSVFNAGSSTYKGLELEGNFALTDALSLTGVLGLIDAEIDEILSGGVNIADQFVTQNTPEKTARLGFAYLHPQEVASGTLAVNGSASYRDEYYLFNVANGGFAAGENALFPQGGPALDPEAYTLLDLSATWTSRSERWRLGLYGRNLTDERYRVAAYNFVTPSPLGADSAYSTFYGAPRTVTASVEYRY